jgi:hypothetical protein
VNVRDCHRKAEATAGSATPAQRGSKARPARFAPGTPENLKLKRPPSGGLGFLLGLQPMQEIYGALRVGGSAEDRAVVVLENL